MYTGRLMFSQVMDLMPMPIFRPAHLQRQSSRYRSMPSFPRQKALSYGHSWQCFQINSSRSQRKTGLAIYAELAQSLIATARTLYSTETFLDELEETVYALDSTTIDFCLSVFPWAPFRKTKSPIKLHTLLDLRGNIPTFIHISDGKLHAVSVLDIMLLKPEPIILGIEAILTSNDFFCLTNNNILCNSSKIQYQIKKTLFTSRGQVHRLNLRSNNCLNWHQKQERISQQTSAHQIQSSKDTENTCFSNEQFHCAAIGHCETI